MSNTRARRSATKTVSYSKEQEFSDEDLFEDDEPPPVKVSAPQRRKKTRKSNDLTGSRGMYDADSNYQDSKPVYTEKGYDPTLPPIRERFSFMPEYEDDGTMKIELIVGRRPVDETSQENDNEDSDDDSQSKEKGSVDNTESSPSRIRGTREKTDQSSPSKSKSDSPGKTQEIKAGSFVEYEYLVKYKGRSYLHLDWKTGADLESMNKSAKGIYSRFLKKLAQGIDEELENPEFDPSFAVPEKIVDVAEQEITIELSDKELLRWEKQREKELALEVGDENDQDAADEAVDKEANIVTSESCELVCERETSESPNAQSDWGEDEEIDFKTVPIERLRAIINKDGPYYPVIEGSDNPYRDGYVTEPPKKPRGSYLFFQTAMRTYYQRKNPQSHLQSELMSTLGDAWRKMSDEEKANFVQLSNEECKQYEVEKDLLDKAQKANGVWQPLRRCMMVLNRLSTEAFAEVFLEPVSLRDFPDYNDVIDHPMDLSTVRKKLETRKYQACEQFARDVRKIWNNCKIYNQHGSTIWYVADYMSKLFERIYHAWVLEFRERYIRWADPRARPWEHSCRIHDGSCKTPDEKMVLCDHCDGMYGMACLDPPMKKVPKQIWHCPDCKPRLKSVKGGRMLSAVAENAARKRAELGDIPKKKITQTMYLVKWAGLGYEFCTWETRKDIANDKLIADFHRINKMDSDEPDMSTDLLEEFLSDVKHVNIETAGGISSVPSLRVQLYAQSRAFQFIKFGKDIPGCVCDEIGPKTLSISSNTTSNYVSRRLCLGEIAHPKEVKECLSSIVFTVCRNHSTREPKAHSLLPPPLTGEYDAIIPITSKGLMMNVGELHGSVAFLGYRQFPGGIKGPAEERNLVRGVGDKIIAVDGVATIGMSFQDVISLLRESGKNKFAYMRFQESRYSACEQTLSSVGPKGRYTYEELQRKFITDRQRILVGKIQENNDGGTEKEDKIQEAITEGESDSDIGSEGSFLPESDDEELVEEGNDKNTTLGTANIELTEEDQVNYKQDSPKVDDKEVSPTSDEGVEIAISATAIEFEDTEFVKPQHVPSSLGVLNRLETTRSLALRLLDMDVGYSSDEAGEEDFAYFVDGVDSSFNSKIDLRNGSIDVKEYDKTKVGDPVDVIPAKQNEFTLQGDRAKLVSAVALFDRPPGDDEFENFPLSSNVEVDSGPNGSNNPDDNTEVLANRGKRSTVKVEQISVATGETIHIWANVEAAAATLQLPLGQLKQVLRGEYDEDIGDEVGGYKWCYALAAAKVTAGNSSSRGGGGKKAKEAWLQFREKLYDPSEPHLYKNGNRLRDYQVDGVNWLASTWYKRQGCILSDEMGLGKTVQIVCYIEHLFRVEKIKRPFLIVVPLSTIEHWRREFEGWTDMVCCVYHDRQRIWRDVLREYEWYFEDRPHTAEFLKFDVLVTTYDTLISDFDVISQIPFRVSVVDEAHRLRNQKGKLLECMREVSARGTLQYGFQSRVLMSGTPLQNDLTELWTLLNFIEPFKFSDLESFQNKFGNMANRSEVEALQKLISPYMLRRVKEDVAKDIPAKEETLIDVEMTSIQKQYYRAIFEHNLAFLNMGASRQNAPKLMNIQMELRKVCNHPFLLEGVEHRESDRLYKEFTEKGVFDGKTPEEQQHILNEHGYVMTSGKMVLLDKLLPKLRQEGHKILIFSQMVKMLDLISEYCDMRGFRHERLDGRVRGTERQKSIDRFEKEKDSFLFLLSTRAGGVGINLTAADICIIFDSDWNPQNDVQAQARCHRIGQTKDVRIYRLITSRSFETEMFERASRKLGLEQAILGTFEKDADDDKPTQQEMEQLLKKGAYALLDDDNDEITREFCADDIESILAKRTRTRVVEGTKTASWLNKQGLNVSKSKFTAESGETLDMDDPLFWQKVMPDFVTPTIMLQKLNDLQDSIEGKTNKGRGRGRKRKTAFPNEPKEKDAIESDSPLKSTPQKVSASPIDQDETSDDEVPDTNGRNLKLQLSRKNVRGVHTFMSDLKNMMENILDEGEDETIKSEEKAVCQKLLLTISVKENIFNEEQRRLARVFLKRLEGDRRRRCRTLEQQRFKPGVENDEPAVRIREELRIVGTKKKKRKKRAQPLEEDVESEAPVVVPKKRQSSSAGGYVGEDGYLHHSDSEDEWSDVVQDSYLDGPVRKDRISRKDSMRRRQWGADDDAATAAGRSWPIFPRQLLKKVLGTLLEEVIKYDESTGGIFSVPVPKDEFPEYYEQVKNPMDYGTMKKKLENGEYRSAQAIQKDFILILQNCRQFNANSSDIVKQAREQHLMRPKLLTAAAKRHNLFLAEDGSVLEIFDEKSVNVKKSDKKSGTSLEQPAKKGKREDNKKRDESDVASVAKDAQAKVVAKKNKQKLKQTTTGGSFGTDDKANEGLNTKLRIKVKYNRTTESLSVASVEPSDKTKQKRESTVSSKRKHDDNVDDDFTDEKTKPVEPKRSRKTLDSKLSKKTRTRKNFSEEKESSLVEDGKKTSKCNDSEHDSTIYLDLSFWKSRREALSGEFADARKNFTEHGPWSIPSPLSDRVFDNIAEKTLERMSKHDKFTVFSEPVSEKEAPGYKEVISQPMDFGTMRKKVRQGKYGTGTKAIVALYEDFLLVFDNCFLYNSEESEVTEEASRMFGLLPEAYVAACINAMKNAST